MISPKVLLQSLAKVILVALMILSLGAGSSIVRLVGWATMIPAQYAETGSMSAAVEKTFSGDFPCAMCELAAAQRAEASQTSRDRSLPEKPSVETKKPTLVNPLLSKVMVYAPVRGLSRLSLYFALDTQYTFTPATPPPRCFDIT